jgi:hypothetical protein
VEPAEHAQAGRPVRGCKLVNPIEARFQARRELNLYGTEGGQTLRGQASAGT